MLQYPNQSLFTQICSFGKDFGIRRGHGYLRDFVIEALQIPEEKLQIPWVWLDSDNTGLSS